VKLTLPATGYHAFGTSIEGVGPVVVGAGALNPASVKVPSQNLRKRGSTKGRMSLLVAELERHPLWDSSLSKIHEFGQNKTNIAPSLLTVRVLLIKIVVRLWFQFRWKLLQHRC
jgi:hypothetical protein